ncbi:MAG: 50S ribosomal protein L7Ae [Euryarchaeota archaeon]|nr:50S ribosomal protein L7Ae [Euryarchaeota archaeon]
MANYVTFEVSEEIQNKALEAVETARETGKIKKGSNEATKAVERGVAQLVIIGADVEPAEIVMHLGPLCEEKKIPYVFIAQQNNIGGACGLEVGCAAAAIIKSGKAKEMIDSIAEQITALKE